MSDIKEKLEHLAKQKDEEFMEEIEAMQYTHDDIERCQEMRHVEKMVLTNRVLAELRNKLQGGKDES